MTPFHNLQLDIQDTQPPPDIPGLAYRPDFLCADQEKALLDCIDAQPWSHVLRRRVQHYGWRYDYTARTVTSDMRLGALPSWARPLALRLVNEGLVRQCPDQLIVNEYVGAQGISRHVDAPGSFADGIVSISLAEPWHMVFRCDERRESLLLDRRSALVLHSDARYQWTHEIPARKSEPGFGMRTRRVSLTFRQVITD